MDWATDGLVYRRADSPNRGFTNAFVGLENAGVFAVEFFWDGIAVGNSWRAAVDGKIYAGFNATAVGIGDL